VVKPYKFPIPKKGRTRSNAPPVFNASPAKGEEEVVGEIQGQHPASKEEWRVAVALSKFGVDYRYQVSYFGGRWFRGGQVIDFVVYNPWPQPVQVYGEYWHTGQLGSEDTLKLARIRLVFGRDAIILWGNELQDQEQANRTVRAKVLGG